MKKHIVCFGDSNTHGFCPDPNGCNHPQYFRFDETERWPTRLQEKLGSDYLIIEEGRNGRTTVFPDPITYGLAGIDYIHPCLLSHKPVDLLIIMLGTNDTKERFGANAFVIGQGLARLVMEAKNIDCWRTKPNILILAPAVILDEMTDSPTIGGMGTDCVEKSKNLIPIYKQVAKDLDCHFLDVNEFGCRCSDFDYMHLSKEAHGIMAENLGKFIPKFL